MKYFLDTEFIESFHKPLFGKRRHYIDLISIGIVAEDGREYYAISTEFDPKDADPWVVQNVINKLPARNVSFYDSPRLRRDALLWKSNKRIKNDILEFIKGDTPEFWAYYADYDWVLFCSIFGRMIDLPEGWPMYCRDLKQSIDKRVLDCIEHGSGTPSMIRKYHEECKRLGGRFTVDFRGGKFEDILEDIKSEATYPKNEDDHNALSDARWNKQLYDFLNDRNLWI